MKQLFGAAALSAVAMMMWGFIFWAGGGADLGFSQLDADTEYAAQELIGRQFPESGTYVLPDQRLGSTSDWTARHLAGPLVFMSVTRAGADPMAPRVYLLGFMHMFVTALLLGLVMVRALPTSMTWVRRFGFAVLVGVVVAFWARLSDPIWFYKPWDYQLIVAMYDVVSFAIMGAILARFLRD